MAGLETLSNFILLERRDPQEQSKPLKLAYLHCTKELFYAFRGVWNAFMFFLNPCAQTENN